MFCFAFVFQRQFLSTPIEKWDAEAREEIFYAVECSHLPRFFKNKGSEKSILLHLTILPPNPPNTLKNYENFAHKILPEFCKTLQPTLNRTSAEIMGLQKKQSTED